MTLSEIFNLVLVLLTGVLGYVWLSSRAEEKEGRKSLKDELEKVRGEMANLRGELRRELNELQKDFNASGPGIMKSEIRELQRNYDLLHRWKNERLPQQLEQMEGQLYNVIGDAKGDSNKRLDRLESRVFNGGKS